MSNFFIYFSLGFKHITDLNGYDHLLFIVVLCSIYLLNDWRKILVLISAFTIGHSITLALSTLDKFTIQSDIIEFLIPITIFITAIGNLFVKTKNSLLPSKSRGISRYVFALVFGLIHGMGFSNYLKSLLGKTSNIFAELLAFNLGLEIGQIIIVVFFLLSTHILINLLNVKRNSLNYIISAFVAGLSVSLIIEKNIF